VDAYKGRVERAVERTGAKPYRDYREVLADKSIDTVVVATRPLAQADDHRGHARGKDVYSEKPMTYRTSEGVEIVRAARETGRFVQVGSQGVSSERSRRPRR